MAQTKDESRLPEAGAVAQSAPGGEPLALPGPDSSATGTAGGGAGVAPGDSAATMGGGGTGEDLTTPDPAQAGSDTGDDISPDDLSLGEIPVIKTIELTLDVAKRALDAYVLVKDKYKDADIEQYENLQDFVDQTADGKSFEADIKAAGFADVNEWNLAITTLGVAYTGVIDDQTADTRQQIEEIRNDPELAKDMKDRMIASLEATIPSENNRKVIETMLDDPAYTEKLKQLDTEEE